MSTTLTMMNDQFKINAAVNHWKEKKTWGRILNQTGFTYRKEPTESGGIKFIVTEPHNPQNVYAVAEEYANGESGEITDLGPYMLSLLNLREPVTLDRQQFVCLYLFSENYSTMLKKEIIPFYEHTSKTYQREKV